MTHQDRTRTNTMANTVTLASGPKTVIALALSAVLALTAGCRSDMAAVQQAPIVDGNAASDPASANLAMPIAGGPVQSAQPQPTSAVRGTRVAGQSYSDQPQSYGETYPLQSARQSRSEAYSYNTLPPPGASQYADAQSSAGQYAQPYNGNDDQLYNDLLDPNVPVAQQPPPQLPVYDQPVAPGPDYLWTPGYWNYAPAGYYYVPGNWVSAPFEGALWTPGWWGYTGRGYGWHRGYWGRHVGYYGGVNYGFGFVGIGYQGGYWNNRHFYYNQNCNHVQPRAVNNYVYQRNVTVANNAYVNNTRVSYNGGSGGLQRRPIPAEFAAQREVHIAPLPAQVAERQQAAQNRQQFFATNNGRPQQVFATHPVLERNVAVPPQLARAPQPAERTGFNTPSNTGSNLQFRQQGAAQQQQAENSRRQQDDQQRSQQQQATQRAQQQLHVSVDQQHALQQQNQQRTPQPQQAVRQQQNQDRLQQQTAYQQQQLQQQQLQRLQRQEQARQLPAPQQSRQPQAPQQPTAPQQQFRQPQPQVRPQPQPRPELQTRPEPQPRPQTQIQPRPQTQTQVRPQPTPQAAPQFRPQPAPQPRAQPSPQPHAEAPHPATAPPSPSHEHRH